MLIRPFVAGTAILLLAAALSAQPLSTTGVPGVNDLVINQLGSGTSSCTVPVEITGGTSMDLEISTLPASPLVGAIADACELNAMIVNPVPTAGSGTIYYVDIELASIQYVFDATGTILPATPLSPFFTADANGNWNFSVTLPETTGGGFAIQAGCINPGFVLGIATTQAHSVDIVAGTLCPNTVGNDLTPLSDDGFVSVTLSSSFPFYGTSYSDIYVNMNGSITFLGGDPDPTATAADMLAGNPRIAPAWDDWDPSDPAQGTVRLSDAGGLVEVEWHDLRHADPACGPGLDSNSFCATMDLATGQITFGYAGMILCRTAVASTTQVVGVSPGSNLSTAVSIDLTSPQVGGLNVAMYEDFGQTVLPGGLPSFDLSHLTTIFSKNLVFSPSAGGFNVAQIAF